jgi:hypothetical protein
MTTDFPLQDTDIVSRVETIVATDMDGEVIMMSVESGQYFHFDDIATLVWHKVEQPCSIGEIIAHVREIYDVSAEECRRDLHALIIKLRDFKILNVARP